MRGFSVSAHGGVGLDVCLARTSLYGAKAGSEKLAMVIPSTQGGVTARLFAGFTGPRRDETAFARANLLTRYPRFSGRYLPHGAEHPFSFGLFSLQEIWNLVVLQVTRGSSSRDNARRPNPLKGFFQSSDTAGKARR